MKKCPHCAEEIQDEAVKCRYCGERLVGEAPVQAPIEHRETSRPSESKAKRSLPFLFWILEIAGIGYFLYLSTVVGAKAIAALLVFAIAAPIVWRVADLIRQFALPSAYFASGMQDLVKKRLFWMVGPQSIGVFGLAGLLALFIQPELLNQGSRSPTPASPPPIATQADLDANLYGAADAEEDQEAMSDENYSSFESTESQAEEAAKSAEAPTDRSSPYIEDSNSDSQISDNPVVLSDLEAQSIPPDTSRVELTKYYFQIVQSGTPATISVDAQDSEKAENILKNFRGNPVVLQGPSKTVDW